MDLLGLQSALDKTNTDLAAALDKITALEVKAATDTQATAQLVLDGLKPLVQDAVNAVNTVTLTINASVTEITALARRLNGAEVKLTLGPEGQ
jgi:hypothetical protein